MDSRDTIYKSIESRKNARDGLFWAIPLLSISVNVGLLGVIAQSRRNVAIIISSSCPIISAASAQLMVRHKFLSDMDGIHMYTIELNQFFKKSIDNTSDKDSGKTVSTNENNVKPNLGDNQVLANAPIKNYKSIVLSQVTTLKKNVKEKLHTQETEDLKSILEDLEKSEKVLNSKLKGEQITSSNIWTWVVFGFGFLPVVAAIVKPKPNLTRIIRPSLRKIVTKRSTFMRKTFIN